MLLSGQLGGIVMAIAFQGAYFQNFDSLAANGTTHAWTNHFTLPGWYLFRQPLPGTAISFYDVNNGSNPRGSFYSYGLTNQSDRALGGLGSGGDYFSRPASEKIAGWIAFAATNTTGLPINSITLNFDGEQWRSGANTTRQTRRLEYGLGATFETVTNWTTPGENFDFTSPIARETLDEVDGNTEGLRANLGGTIPDLTWGNNQTLWIRWVTLNESGHDHGLAIDNFSLVWYSAIISQSEGLTNVTEGSATDTYTVVLSNPPTADVTITINPDNQTTTGVNSLIFTPENWNQPQTVQIVAVDDNMVEGNHIGTITHTATSTDPNYNGISINSVTANITDNDRANNSPVIVNAIADLTATVSTLFNFTIPADTFTEPDSNPLTYSATLEDGSDLPQWLIFDSTTRTFNGTPFANHVGNINIKVTAFDGSLFVSDIFTLSVSAVTPNPEIEGENAAESELNPPELEANNPQAPANNPHLNENTPAAPTNNPEAPANNPELNDNPLELEANNPDPPANNSASEATNPEAPANNPELNEENTPDSEANNPEAPANNPELNEENTPDSEANNPEANENTPQSQDNSLVVTDIETLQFGLFGPTGPSYFKEFLANRGGSSPIEVNLSNIFQWISTLEELSTPSLSSSDLSQLDFQGKENTPYNILIGTPESDFIQASSGDNFIQGLGGNDSLLGGEENYIFPGNPGDNFIHTGAENNWIHGVEGGDTLVGGDGVDILYGNEGNDLMYAGGGNNFLYGNQQNDTLIGKDGDDVLYAGKDDDLLIGGAGDDWLFGDLGNDVLMGGAGKDRFIIGQNTGIDLIVDFTDGEDLIGLAPGLTGENLTLTQGNSSTLIYAGNDLVAILNPVKVSDMNQPDFFAVG
ncbi:putative Ig domain-containing protein [Laspinema olomoucense]|uniref:Ig domain-containing protein n=1 Tax=Laspinema olomoucense D3b TaxID=2953688 RepID=A0ABT2N6I5_9CYAN|nr:putative Ig domain-containing protein [Laspinema sp. D3b]MCT7976985.1 putative Ig domain-containing protein [Laspinema sp. D3b]